ncbi:ribonuclease 3 precursor, putative [Entamoeba invadens IP1]|uniref:Ribonuclease 3, putative n=1 Tax=Entamoeba invadens IP1 TaxID=370355 RepID=A0A0A1UBM4_ENTIV|nr:ribonuclease 3 precursor, putative [Entamoeba invadens IP1]ELP92526.1 ribonuclease 3 precursor, putative [Entamoeba invadens IP1]|eukprot:XP_004259297.1 ribonuclease 3 precursor, putative [Entamoeba invadens IP1]
MLIFIIIICIEFSIGQPERQDEHDQKSKQKKQRKGRKNRKEKLEETDYSTVPKDSFESLTLNPTETETPYVRPKVKSELKTKHSSYPSMELFKQQFPPVTKSRKERSTFNQVRKKIEIQRNKEQEESTHEIFQKVPFSNEKDFTEKHLEIQNPLKPVESKLTIKLDEKTLRHLREYDLCSFYNKYAKKFQILIFVLFWPGEKCQMENSCSFPLKTTKFKERFFLHGLWPNFWANQNMLCCSTYYTPLMVEQRIREDAKLFECVVNDWMSVEKCRFAAFQMDKHGSCASNIYDGENGYIDYMKLTLKLYESVDLWQVLKESILKVEVEKVYEIEDIRNVVANVYGAKVAFFCRERGFLQEVRICYDPFENKYDPKPVECPPKLYKDEMRKCGNKIQIRKYPPYLLDPNKVPRNDCEF